MKRIIVALTSTVLGFGLGATATAAWAHGPHGHGKTSAEQCKRILDPAVQAECLRCVATDGKAFFSEAQGPKRCAEADHDHD